MRSPPNPTGLLCTDRTDAGQTLATFFVLGAVWLVTHPWRGLAHDAIFYSLQAMRHIAPAIFAGDPFFGGVSQDDYSLFGRALAQAVALASLRPALVGLWVVAQFLWIVVVMNWVRSNPATRSLFWPACAALCGSAAPYGAEGMFHAAESFLTARSFAEPLTLAAILLLWRARPAPAFTLIIAAASIHPLVTLPGVLCGALLIATRPGMSEAARRCESERVAPMLLASLVVLSLITAGLLCLSWDGNASLPSAFRQIDPAWLQSIERHIGYAVVDHWSTGDWVRSLLPASILLAAARFSEPGLAQLWRTVAATSLMGLALAIVASITRWELGLQVQGWRFTWLAAWLAPLALIAALAARPCLSDRILLLAGIPALALSLHDWFGIGPWLQVAYLVMLLRLTVHQTQRFRTLERAQVSLAIALTGAALGCGIAYHLRLHELAGHPVADGVPALNLAAKHFGWLLAPLALLIPMDTVLRRPGSRPAVALASALFAAAAWDGRSPRDVALWEMIAHGLSEWSSAIPENGSVYWPDHPERVWFVLNRRSYASKRQLNGSVMFDQPTSQLIERRLVALGPLAILDREGIPQAMPLPSRSRFEESTISTACRAAGLDFAVGTAEAGRDAVSTIKDPLTGRRLALYRCRDSNDRQPPDSTSRDPR